MIGIITGRKIGKNKGGDVDRLVLQVEVIENEDTRSIELFPGAGVDVNPAKNSRVNIIDVTDSYQIAGEISDDLTPETNAGETEIYSTDDPVTMRKARVKCDSSGNVVLNAGTNHAVQYEALLSAFNQLKSDLNNLIIAYNLHEHISAIPGNPTTGNSNPGTASTADMTGAKENTVKLP